MEVAVDQRLPEVDIDVAEAVEVGLQARKPRHQYSDAIVHNLTKVSNGDGETSENRAYLDVNGGAIEDLDSHKILNVGMYDLRDKGKYEVAIVSGGETGGTPEPIEEDTVEEEVVELEFQKAIPKLHTHTMHCPNCDSQITKVVLRRRIFKQKTPPITKEPDEPVNLVGCLSCFSLFLPAGNGSFNPFPIFGSKRASNAASQPAGNEGEASREDGNCFSIFPGVWKPAKDPPQAEPGYVDPFPVSLTPDIKYDSSEPPIGKGRDHGHDAGKTTKPEYSPATDQDESRVGFRPSESPESIIDVRPAISTTNPDESQRPIGQDSTSFEILKSIVYGGLMEVIASLSVVASAAAADATTLSIIALALANLIGGVLVIGHNIWDLRDDCYKYSSQQANGETRNKYKELLGQVEHFPLHMFSAILSFLVFGIIPPLAYGYSFHQTNDRDFTIVVVAVASLVCVILLAIFKAYIDKCTGFLGYAKTTMYYLITAVSVSGVSYVIGNLVMRLVDQLGLFETTSSGAMSLLPTNPSLAYY